MKFLSIQSHVSYGHVGNAAAAFALQRLGHDVWPLHTVLFSNHPGYGHFGGGPVAPEAVATCAAGLEALGVLPGCDGAISGYLGTPGTGAVVADLVTTLKAANPAARYCCDPVLGDDGRLYVSAETAAAVDRLVGLADVVTPNLFELAHLTGLPVQTSDDIHLALSALHRRGPLLVLLTSVTCRDLPSDELRTVASTTTARFVVTTPRLPIAAHGAGDLMAALFFAHWLGGGDAGAALAQAVAAVYGVLAATHARGGAEMALIAAQDELMRPQRRFIVAPFASRA